MSDSRRPARLGFLLSQLGTYASDLFAELVEPLGITPREAGVIRIVGRADGMSQRELSLRLHLAQSRVVVLLDQLEAAGFISRIRRSQDRRVQEVRLTDTGVAMLRKLRAVAEEQERRLTDGLDDRQREELYRRLSELLVVRELDADVHRAVGASDSDEQGSQTWEH